MKLLLLCAGAALVSAKCANDCSSHGDCNAKNQCECHRNYFGADCSQRLCPAGRSFVDSALGDANGDNAVGVDLVFTQGKAATAVSELFNYQYGAGRDSFDVTSSWNEAHFYAECSNKGVCDTSTGQCACFPGYEGSGCARKSCENDCSGHGACKNYEGTSYNMWDNDATLYCDCDAGYTGPGCESRVCPSGVDPVQGSNLDTSRFYQIGFKTLDGDTGSDFDDSTFYTVPFGPVTWTITLTDEFGDEWTTSLITTNYDVIVDTTNDLPLYSMPIITAGVEDPAAAWTESSDDTSAIDIPTKFNSFADGNNHVADSVREALEALPNNAAGGVVVHELYTVPSSSTADIDLLSSTFPQPFTGYSDPTYVMSWPAVCGRYDIYIGATDIAADGAGVPISGATVAGCGVAIFDTQMGSGACTARAGNTDIEDFLGNTGTYAGSTFTGIVSDVDTFIIYDVGPTGDEINADLTTLTPVPIVPSATNLGEFFLYSGGNDGEAIVYYQYPHFSNGDGPETRFPLVEDLVADCEIPTSGNFYATGSTYTYDSLKLSDGSVPGLSLFVYFEESTIETAPRVDFSFNNMASDAFLSVDLFNAEVAGVGVGEMISGTSGGSGDYASHSLVEVVDRGGDRVWDVAFHGRQAYFLDDGSDTSTDVWVHTCAKRGLCDYGAGLCDCFSGFTGTNCAEQNALAF